MNILQKRKMNSRLVRAAATEKSSPPSIQASSKRKVRLSSWRGGRRKNSDAVSEGGTTATTCETREGNEDDFFRRFHVTVVKTRTESSRPEDLARDDEELLHDDCSGTPQKKSVRFHKYDEVWNGGPREFVYSLYDRERQEETDRDLADDFEDVVGNVTHFFKCIKKGLEEVTAKPKHDSFPSAHLTSEHCEEESFSSNTDDDDSEIDESSLSTYDTS